jgi:uncharacterized protein YrrD
MRKYLLLATTAMLFAGNAMAGSIADNKQSATINAIAEIHAVARIEAVSDLNFGKMLLDPTIPVDSVLVSMGDDGVVTTELTDDVVIVDDAGSFGGACASDGMSGNARFTVTCANGTGNPLEGGKCALGSTGYSIGDVTGVSFTSPAGKCVANPISEGFKANLYKSEETPMYGVINEAALKVTLSY